MNTGEVVADKGHDRGERLVTGDAVNTAKRLEVVGSVGTRCCSGLNPWLLVRNAVEGRFQLPPISPSRANEDVDPGLPAACRSRPERRGGAPAGWTRRSSGASTSSSALKRDLRRGAGRPASAVLVTVLGPRRVSARPGSSREFVAAFPWTLSPRRRPLPPRTATASRTGPWSRFVRSGRPAWQVSTSRCRRRAPVSAALLEGAPTTLIRRAGESRPCALGAGGGRRAARRDLLVVPAAARGGVARRATAPRLVIEDLQWAEPVFIDLLEYVSFAGSLRSTNRCSSVASRAPSSSTPPAALGRLLQSAGDDRSRSTSSGTTIRRLL